MVSSPEKAGDNGATETLLLFVHRGSPELCSALACAVLQAIKLAWMEKDTI